MLATSEQLAGVVPSETPICGIFCPRPSLGVVWAP